MATESKLFTNSPFLALANAVVEMVGELEKARYADYFDGTIDETVLLLEKAKAYQMRQRGVMGIIGATGKVYYPLMVSKGANDILAPAIKSASVPGVNEEERIQWLSDRLRRMRTGDVLSPHEREKIAVVFRSIAKEAVG